MADPILTADEVAALRERIQSRVQFENAGCRECMAALEDEPHASYCFVGVAAQLVASHEAIRTERDELFERVSWFEESFGDGGP